VRVEDDEKVLIEAVIVSRFVLELSTSPAVVHSLRRLSAVSEVRSRPACEACSESSMLADQQGVHADRLAIPASTSPAASRATLAR